jgi:hypothetical protein
MASRRERVISMLTCATVVRQIVHTANSKPKSLTTTTSSSSSVLPSNFCRSTCWPKCHKHCQLSSGGTNTRINISSNIATSRGQPGQIFLARELSAGFSSFYEQSEILGATQHAQNGGFCQILLLQQLAYVLHLITVRALELHEVNCNSQLIMIIIPQN